MCMCLAQGGIGGDGGEWMRGLGLGFTNPGNRGSVGRVSVLVEVGRGLGPGFGGVGWCYVCVSCESGFSVYMAVPGICILCLVDTHAS